MVYFNLESELSSLEKGYFSGEYLAQTPTISVNLKAQEEGMHE